MRHDTGTDRDFAGAQSVDDDALIRAELAPGEKLVWTSRPQVARSALLAVPMVMFGVVFGGFGLFWVGSASQFDSGFFPLFGLPFCLIGVGLIFSPGWIAWKALRTRYAITDRRAILCEPRFLAGIETRSYTADALANIVRTQRGDGSGDLIFEEIRTRDHKGHTRTTRRGFEAIADVRGVENLLRSTLLAHPTQP